MLPILYSFRRCPYAIRARMAICYSGIKVDLREVDLKQKPQAMLDCSIKGTVPVLQLVDGTVIDESLDIMRWAIAQYDPEHWLPHDAETSDEFMTQREDLLNTNDGIFKKSLDRYKYADHYPEHSADYYRQQGEIFLLQLELLLEKTPYLMRATITLADMAIFPFVRQFAFVDKAWFEQCRYVRVRQWLHSLLALPLFERAMTKYPVWQAEDQPQLF